MNDESKLPAPDQDGDVTAHATKPPEIARMTMDEARAGVARLLNSVLNSSTTELQAALAQDPERDTSNQAHNGKMMLMAAMEFIQGNNILIKRLERPTILRPTRSNIRKLHRGH